jgi:hypothetical protein
MEQLLAHLLAEMNVIKERTDTSLQRMAAKIGAEIKTIHEKDGFKPRKGQSLLLRNKKRWTMDKR